MKKFYQYLKDKDQKESTASAHVKNIERFMQWSAESGRMGIEQITYTELLEYVQHLKERNVQPQTINLRLNSIRQYYEFLKSEGICEVNPAKRLFIKGTIKKVVVNPLAYCELEKLFCDYVQYAESKTTNNRIDRAIAERNKVMLSFMIWQALHSGELHKIRKEHIRLSEGSIDVPGAARSNSRTLSLAPLQIILLNNYLQSLPPSALVFAGHIHQQLVRLIRALQGINPVIKNAGHIRASVILHWVKIYDKRKVQYMIGHRNIGSTERYEVQQLDTLTDQLQRYHPFA